MQTSKVSHCEKYFCIVQILVFKHSFNDNNIIHNSDNNSHHSSIIAQSTENVIYSVTTETVMNFIVHKFENIFMNKLLNHVAAGGRRNSLK